LSCKKTKSINTPGNLVPETVDQDLSLPSISVNGIKLHSEAFGNPDDPLVVVVHGGPGGDYRYLLNCKEFANHGYRVVFYDQAGSGLSQRLPKSYYSSLQLVYDELTGVIEHYKTHSQQKVFLIGHSWGGMLSTAYINQYPSVISGAILAEPGGFIWNDIINYVGKTKTTRITSESLNDITYIDQFLTGKEDEQQILDYKFSIISASDGNSENLIGNEGFTSFWRLGAVSNMAIFELGQKDKPDWTTHLDQFAPKVLFLYSENNKAYGLDWARRVSSPFKNIELYEVMGAGHDMLSFSKGWNNSFPKMLSYFNSL
jgi:proline iminopeptidase